MDYRLFADKGFVDTESIKKFCVEWNKTTKELRDKLQNGKNDRFKHSK